MNQVVENNGQTYALLSSILDVSDENKTQWYGKDTESLQGSRMHYMKGKTFRTHKHKLNPRLINRTQECFIIVRGKIQMDIYDDTPNEGAKVVNDIFGKTKFHIGSLVGNAGDIIFVWRGFHRLSILEDYTIAYEIKAGQFTSVEEDKEFFDVN